MPRSIRRLLLSCVALAATVAGPLFAEQTEDATRDEAVRAMKRAAVYFHKHAASHGGYVYYYSLDFSERWGEGRATPDTIFVQPPGTPAVGLAYLKAYDSTKDRFYLDAARDAAAALMQAQLKSGGWTQSFQFDPAAKPGERRPARDGFSSLDDGQTQTALRFLIRLDRTLAFQDAALHESAVTGLTALLKAQFPIGAFPQGWRAPVAAHPVGKASYPTYDWKTEGRLKNYWDYYTLNDNLAGTVCETLIEAQQTYGEEKYRIAIEKLGDFLVAAQMPEPQPAWCQQYNYEMLPIWARKFEPPAVSGWESQDAVQTLIRIARHTGRKQYLEPIPRTLAYLKTCLLPDGRIARYYEFQSNKPLYMDGEYRLTYDDSNAPSHYGWKQSARLDKLQRDYRAALNDAAPPAAESATTAAERQAEVRKILSALDAEGRWISTFASERLVGQPKFAVGFRYLSSEVFRRNLETLSD